MQYTIRGIPKRVDEALRRRARRQRKSLNQVALEALAAGAGESEAPARYRDLSGVAASWVEDAETERELERQRTVEPADWR